MTVSSTTTVTRTNTNGSAHTFNFGHPFGDPDDLLVYLVTLADWMIALQVKDTDYTVSNNGNEAEVGGSITFINGLAVPTAPATGKQCVILRKPDLTQDFNPNGSYPSRQGEAALDRIYQLLQYHRYRDDRTIHLNDAYSDAALELPDEDARANKALGFDADGDLAMIDRAVDLLELNTTAVAEAEAAAAAAAQSASDAEQHKNAAAVSAANALVSENNAATSESNAATSESNASSSASTATTQAGIATTQAGIATTQASNASTSASNALTSENNAETAETNAETAASTATTQAGIATTQAGIATTQAGNASTSAANAATAETNAETAEANAELAQGYAEEWATNPENDPVSVAAGGDDSTTFSALHWAAKAAASAASVTTEAFQDIVGAMTTGNTETGISVTYQDADGTIDFAVTGALEDLNTLGPPANDGEFLVATGAGTLAWESGATARTSLGLAIGTNVQAFDADLTTWAGLTPSANMQTLIPQTFAQMRTSLGLAVGSDVQAWDPQLDTWATLTPSANHQTMVTQTFAQMRGSLDLEIGTDVQAWSANLDEYAGVNPAANTLTLLGGADFAAWRTSLGLVIGTNVQAWDAQLDSLSAASANGVSLVTAATYATMRGLLDLEAGTDFYSISAANAAFQPIDVDLTSIAALTTTAAGRSVLTIADPGADRIVAWDDTAGSMAAIALADITAEGTPASGDFFLAYTAEGALVKVDFDNMPGAGGGISNVSEDTDPELGGNLDLNSNDINGTGNIDITGDIDATGDVTAVNGVFSGDVSVLDDAYDATDWNANTDVPTKNAVRDVIEGLSSVYQPLDGGLTDIAGLAVTDSNIIVGNGTNWVAESGATARTSLGLAIGTNVQAWDAQLDTWATVTPSANGQSLVAAANYAAMKGLLDLEIGTDVQAWDAQLDSLSAASANGVSLVTSANYATMRGLLDLEAGTDFYSVAAADAAFVPMARTVTAGTGLTDGGALSGNITLNVAAGTGILANANDVAVDKASDANVHAAVSNKVVTSDLIESASAIVTLTETAGAVAVDWDTFVNGEVTVDQATVISNPTNGQPGTWRTILVLGNDTTDRTITFGNQFLGEVPTITDADSTRAYLLAIYCRTTTHFVVSSKKAMGT